MPVVSVIIPVYNVQAYLKNCLDSLTAQTFTDWEAICVDDGSTDDCPKILKQYAQKDSRFKIIKRIFIPNILKQQLSKVQNCDTSSAIDMQRAFAEELVDLNEKGLIGLRGHKIKRYFLYKRFIKQYQRENQNAV